MHSVPEGALQPVLDNGTLKALRGGDLMDTKDALMATPFKVNVTTLNALASFESAVQLSPVEWKAREEGRRRGA